MKSSSIVVFLFLLVTGCGKKNVPEPEPSPILDGPAAASLALPKQDQACTDGTLISATESTISFSWSAANHTDSYELFIKNLLTGISRSQSTTSTQLQITLLRDTPYSWYVLSRSGKVSITAQSTIWKFYNAGPGTVSYAPYPAEVIAPAFGQALENTSAVDLVWKGSAVENNIIGYDVYFGTSTTLTILKSDLKDSFLKNVNVVSNTRYYWKVITKDSRGNSSDSGLSQFKVNE